MSIKRIIWVFLMPGFLALSSTLYAAELRGQFTGVPEAVVRVDCPGGSGSSAVGSTGNYAVRGLPSGQNCSFTVSGGGGVKSASIPFSTSRSVTIYSGKLRLYNGKILVIRQ